MIRRLTILAILGIGLAAHSVEGSGNASLRLLLSEVQPGSMGADHYCTLVFDDRHFHYEKAKRHLGKDLERKVYEGQLSDADWAALTGILDTKEFRELNVPPNTPPLVVQESHPYTISVAREDKFQNMEFLTKESLKPYEGQIRPLLKWWKSSRSARMNESSAPTDNRCSLNSSQAIFAN